MKKALAFLVFFLIAAQMPAQDIVLLNRIKAANGKIQSFEADLKNTMVKPKTTRTQASSPTNMPLCSPMANT